MLLGELLHETDATYLMGSEEKEIGGIAIDSRKVLPGEVFACISGALLDGNAFALEAVEKGALALVIDHGEKALLEQLQKAQEEKNVTADVAVVRVADARTALARMTAVWFGHPARSLTTIGITGTKGKTTTTYLIKSILENAGRKVGLIGTNEVIIGRRHVDAGNTTPDALLLQGYFRQMVDEGLDTVVMEVSSQAIKLKRTEGILFDFGIFTNLSPDHVAPGEHKDFQEYLECKRELFRQCKVGVVNGDDPYVEAVTEGHTCRLETYGMKEGCMLRAENISYVNRDGRLGAAFRVSGEMDFEVCIPMPGIFSVYNALAAICICRHFHVRESDVQRSMLAAKVKGRIELVASQNGYFVLIDYAHNPMALASLLETLRAYQPKRLICLFGCGGDRPVMRRRVMGRISGQKADFTIITDDNPRSESPRKIREQIREGVLEVGGTHVVIAGRRKAIQYAISMARPGDVIVLAGKGHEIYQEIQGVKYPMDEREIVREIMG